MNERRDVRWKWTLLALCGVAFALWFVAVADQFGLGSRAWYGWWDANASMTGRPFGVQLYTIRPGGASYQAGLRDRDSFDLRDLSLDARIAVTSQLMATQPLHLIVHRGSRTFETEVQGSTVWEGAPLWKLPAMILRLLAVAWFAACAVLIVLRRWWAREARLLALVLLCQINVVLSPATLVLPNGALRCALAVVSGACIFAAAATLIYLSSQFGARSLLRRIVEGIAYATNAAVLLGVFAFAYGVVTLKVDPILFASMVTYGDYGAAWGFVNVVAVVSVVAVACFAVAGETRADRVRAAWILLPLPLAGLGTTAVINLIGLAQSWYALLAIITVWGAISCLGALAVTYALLKRRVLDFEFVLSRALVFATLSFVVVAAFVLLEWLLGTVLANVSHATGLAANAALALALGLSMSYLHRRVDTLIDSVFFRKRHDDERALRAFSKEAAYVTQPGALLDQAMAHIEKYTDASGAAVMVDGTGSYVALRSFGSVTEGVDENDPAILALKAWHKPIDPHQYETSLKGALALPMLGRGRLIGVVVLGERSGSEAYAPDEIDALSEFAHGVGFALDSLSANGGETELRAAIVELAAEVSSMPERIAQIWRSGPSTGSGRQ